MNPAPLLMAAAATILGVLGSLHLLYTFHGNRLSPRDPALQTAMARAHLVITRQTTVWRAHQGFNASHSLGLILFGLVYAYLPLWRPEVLARSPFLSALGLVVLVAYGVLARCFFFSVPFRGVVIAGVLYAAGWALL